MIIGVGNGKFMWMYGMGFGVPRALGDSGLHVCIPNVVMQIRRAGVNFKVAWGEFRRLNSRFFVYFLLSQLL